MYGSQFPSQDPNYSEATPWMVPGGTAGDVAMQRANAADQEQRMIHERNVMGAETAAQGAGLVVLLDLLISRIVRSFRR